MNVRHSPQNKLPQFLFSQKPYLQKNLRLARQALQVLANLHHQVQVLIQIPF